jgi:hypothetical protein
MENVSTSKDKAFYNSLRSKSPQDRRPETVQELGSSVSISDLNRATTSSFPKPKLNNVMFTDQPQYASPRPLEKSPTARDILRQSYFEREAAEEAAFTKAKTEVAFGSHMVPKKKSKSKERPQASMESKLKTVMPSMKAAMRAAYEKKMGQTDKSLGRKTSQGRRPVTATLKTTKRKTIDNNRVISPIETLLSQPSTRMGASNSVGSKKYTMSKKI